MGLGSLISCWTVLLSTCVGSASASIAGPSPSFDWKSIVPSRDVEWHKCYSGTFECARLVLPMDWLSAEPELQTSSSSSSPHESHHVGGDGSSNRTIAVAIIKLPAAVPDSDPTFAGPIFSNPGGPGNSGVEFLLVMGNRLQHVADRPGRRHYEIVSFDPRGVGESEPRADCFGSSSNGSGSSPVARQFAALADRGGTGGSRLDMGRAALTYGLAAAQVFGRRCEEADDLDVMSHVGTPSVARDMVEMADRMELERARRHQRQRRDQNIQQGEVEPAAAIVGIKYIGFSYGTVLGSYLAALFPHRVSRLVLDGVCDVLDYATGPGWLTNLADTDAVFDSFLKGCHRAGPSGCALARPDDHQNGSSSSSSSSWTTLRRRVFDFIDGLDDRPSPITMPDGSSAVITGHDVRKLVGYMIYRPLVFYGPLARLLDSAMRGDTTLLAAALVDAGDVPLLQESCSAPGGSGSGSDGDGVGEDPAPIAQGIEGFLSILCGDGEDVSDRDPSWWADYVARQVSSSRLFGAYWSTIRFACSGWRFRAHWSFRGPFSAPAVPPPPPPKSGQGSPGSGLVPPLFLSNRLDPVTPLRNARAMAGLHPGAAVIVQESAGHCALMAAPSRCTADIVAEYLDHGTLPEGEKHCPADCGPWDKDCRLDEHDSVATSSPHGSQQIVLVGGLRDGSSVFRQASRGLKFPRNPLGIF